MRFLPGLPIPGPEITSNTTNLPIETEPVTTGLEFRFVLQGILSLAFTLFLIGLIIGLVKNVKPKRIMQLGLGVTIPLIILFLLHWTTPTISNSSAIESQEAELAPVATYAIEPIGFAPAGLFNMVLISLIVAAVLLVVWLAYHSFRRPHRLEPFTQEAEAALQAIESGQDLSDVIIQCYIQMTLLVKEQIGIERKESVTAREFEKFLIGRGIPEPAIRQITRVFEKVRYGNGKPDRQDELDAIASLSVIRSHNSHPQRRVE